MEEEVKKPKKRDAGEGSAPIVVYIKFFFLLLLILGGVLAVHAWNARKTESKNPVSSPSKTLETILGAADEVPGARVVKRFAEESSHGNVLSAVSEVGNSLQKTATEAAGQAVDRATDHTVDFIYDNTIVQVIEKMIQSLPERSRDTMIERMCGGEEL